MNIFTVLLFSIFLGAGLYLTGDGCVTKNYLRQRDSGNCQIKSYTVQKGDQCDIVQHLIAIGKDHCHEDRLVVNSVPCEQATSAIEKLSKELPVGSDYICYFELNNLFLLNQSSHELNQQIWLGIILTIIGLLPLFLRERYSYS